MIIIWQAQTNFRQQIFAKSTICEIENDVANNTLRLFKFTLYSCPYTLPL